MSSGAKQGQRDEELADSEDDNFRRAAAEERKEIHTALPGIIVSFDAAAQTAKVKPAIKRLWVDDGWQELPECVDVPVYFPAGGDFVLTFPVRANDECLLVFAERAIDDWFERGGVQESSEHRLHDLSDAFALVGFTSKPRRLTPPPSGAGAELRSRNGSVVLHIDGTSVYVGAKAGAEKTLMAETYRQREITEHSTITAALTPLLAAAATWATETATLAVTYPLTAAYLTALTVFMTAFQGAITAFESAPNAASYLSTKARVR